MGKNRKAQGNAEMSAISSESGQKNGANARNRTEDLFITSEPLYRLSYVGIPWRYNITQKPSKIKVKSVFLNKKQKKCHLKKETHGVESEGV